MIYQFKIPGIYDVDAQTAGEELNRIYEKHGSLTPEDVVAESRDEHAPLHSVFEWDDSIAAERYREQQAGTLIRAVVTVAEDNAGAKQEVRAFVNTRVNYQPINVVLATPDMTEFMLSKAMDELMAFRRKYAALSKLRPLIEVIDEMLAESA